MKRVMICCLCAFVCIWCLFPCEVRDQNAKIDSLQKIVEQNLSRKQDDTSSVKALNDLAFETHFVPGQVIKKME